ncbi:hypothetical protein [Brevibacillus nitrificans]|uniref:hypothetical protein n=1 Tax=Brevibacillus nitrificans TaxID=651560 RepID=UPI0016062322|nr:hypothetical protein [Brevibacillus nitrificans]
MGCEKRNLPSVCNECQVLASSTKLLKKTQGTHKDFILGDSIRLPYPVQTDREQVTKLMADDYTYRIKIK